MSAQDGRRQLINSKKVQLISQLKQKQEQYRREIEQCEQRSAQIHSKIFQECQELNATAGKLKERAEEYIKTCVKSLDVGFVCKEMINIKELASYLKSQKEMLLKLSSKQAVSKSKDFDLHGILSKSKFEQTLLKLKKLQLQEEIKFLQTNVLVKNTIVYNPAASSLIPASEEKEINARLESMINQLERLITLSIGCVSHQDQSEKVGELENQTARLKECEALLISQYQKLTRLTKYFESECLNIGSTFVSSVKKTHTKIEQPKEVVWQPKRVLQSQLDSINDAELPKTMLVSQFLHSFNDCEEHIELIRKKYKQFEHLHH